MALLGNVRQVCAVPGILKSLRLLLSPCDSGLEKASLEKLNITDWQAYDLGSQNWKFVKTTTTEGSPQFVPPEARIATVLAEAGSEVDDENLCLGFSISFSTN